MLITRKAIFSDLDQIINLLFDDDLGSSRESLDDFEKYQNSFNEIDEDKNQYLMILEKDNNIIGFCHLTLIPSLSFKGSKRMQIESVRIKKECRGSGLGSLMMNEAINYAKQNNVKIIQLTTNKERSDAKNFYEKIGFKPSHEGMKLYIL